MKKIIIAFLALLATSNSFAQNIQTKTLYRTGVYGQTFELVELSDDDGCILCLIMSDNKKTNRTGVTFYDSDLPTTYYIFSNFFTNPSEYSKAIEVSKEFFDKSMVLVYLADMKDICDIAPCCELEITVFSSLKTGQNIYIFSITART